MLFTYQNSKGETVELADMETRHIIYAMCKNARAIGSGELDAFTQDQKENEIKGMQNTLEERARPHWTLSKLADAILEYESDTFSATETGITRAEALYVAEKYCEQMVENLVEKQEVHLVADGMAIGDILDDMRDV